MNIIAHVIISLLMTVIVLALIGFVILITDSPKAKAIMAVLNDEPLVYRLKISPKVAIYSNEKVVNIISNRLSYSSISNDESEYDIDVKVVKP